MIQPESRTRNLPKLSSLLKDRADRTLKKVLIKHYEDYVHILRTFNKRTKHEEELIDDFNQIKKEFTMSTTKEEDTANRTMANETQVSLLQQALQPYLTKPKPNLNELVVKPESFDGYRPKPREWIDDYESAFIANDWDGATAVKFFPTFLRETALDWFKTMVRPKLTSVSSWADVKGYFVKHYLGREELRQRKRELDSALQGPREPSISFIPRVYKMIRLISSHIDERDAVDKIVDKMRPEIISGLALLEPQTIEELVELSTKIESKERRVEDRQRKSLTSQNRQRRDEVQPNQQAEGPVGNPGFSKTGVQQVSGLRRTNMARRCYRCGREGHIGKDCVETAHISGGAIRMPKGKTSDSEGGQKMHAVVQEEPKLVLNRLATTSDIVHSIDQPDAKSAPSKVSEVSYMSSDRVHKSRRLMYQAISCNGVNMLGMIDTGSFNSIIDAKTAAENNWTIDRPAPILGAAGNNPLKCIGTCEVKFELKINKRTRCSSIHVAVVAGLGTDLILGLEFLQIFQLVIDVSLRQIYFKKASFEKVSSKGVRTKGHEILAPKSQTVIEASIDTVGHVITLPSDLGNGVFVANSVSEVIDNQINVLILNPTNSSIPLEPDTYLASFELLPSGSEHDVNRIIEVDSFDESVSVGEDLTSEQIDELRDVLAANKRAFTQRDRIGCFNDPRFFHKIDLLPESKPFDHQLRRRPQIHIEETRRQVKQMLDQGIIEPSESPWSSAYLLVRKKSGEYRLCIDFRKLNSVTKKLAYPLPNIEECIDTLAGKKYFSLLDFSSGFWQLPMDKASRELTAFKTEDGLFQYTRMPFGLANAPSSFQRMVNAMLSGLRGVNLQIFIDDICIASETWAEHIQMIDQVLKVVIKSNMTLKSAKCMFGAKQVLFLGHEISASGIRQDPEKTKALLQMPPPKDAPGVRRTLGMLGYYRKFIPNFAAISEPLTKLLKKGAKFVWTETEQQAFETLLQALAKDIRLAHFNHVDPVCLKTDASLTGVAALLLQKQNGEWRLISCCSRRLNQHEANYAISELEGLAVIYALAKFRSYLLGKHFKIWTDHSALTVWNGKDPKSARLKRWALLLSEFDCEMVYTKGQLQADVDCFSRAPVDPPDCHIENRIFAVVVPLDHYDWMNHYSDDQSKRFLKLGKDNENNFSIKEGVIYFKDLLYVPPSKVVDIIKETHVSPVSGHGGVRPTTMRLAPYWWPNKTEDIQHVVASCQICQARKIERARPAGEMSSFNVFKRNKIVAIDILGPITESLSLKRFVIVGVDCFTRFVRAKAIADTSSSSFISFLLDWIGTMGIPSQILTDNAKSFDSKYGKQIEEVLQISHIFSTPTHSQGNAIAERAIQSLQDKLNLTLKQRDLAESQWDLILPIAVLSLNTAVHSSTGYSAYEMTFGSAHPTKCASTNSKDNGCADIHVDLLRRSLEEVHANAVEKQSDAQVASKQRYDASHRQLEFCPGELVWVRNRSRASKLADKFDRIAEVISRDGDIYKLCDCDSKFTFSRHVSKLKRHQPTVNFINEPQTRNMCLAQRFVITLAVLACIPNTSSTADMRNGNFVAWKKLSVNVLEAKQEYDVIIRFTDPCTEIKRQFPYFHSPSSAEHDTLYYAYHGCSDTYHRNVIKPMEDLVSRYSHIRHRRSTPLATAWPYLAGRDGFTTISFSPRTNTSVSDSHSTSLLRERRAIPMLGLIGGIWLSNVIDSVFNENDEIAMHEKQQDEYLEALNRKQNYTTEAIVELAQSSKFLIDKVNKLYSITDERAREGVKLSFALTRFATSASNKKIAIENLRFSLINHRRLNLQALNSLLDTNQFETIDSNTVELVSFERYKHDGFQLRFFAHRISETKRVFEVKTLAHWINTTESSASLIRYSGPPKVLVDLDSNCVLGLQDTEPESLSQTCNVRNFRSSDLDSWIKVQEGNPFKQKVSTMFIEELPNLNVYCLGREISINNAPAIECPPYALSIPSHIPWKTEDRSFMGYPRISLAFTVTSYIPDAISPSNIQSPPEGEFIATNALKRIYNLTATLEEEGKKTYALNTPVGGLSYSILTKILLTSVVCCIIVIVYGWYHNHATIRRHHQKILHNIEGQFAATFQKMHKGPDASIGIDSIYPSTSIEPQDTRVDMASVAKSFAEKQDTILTLITGRAAPPSA